MKTCGFYDEDGDDVNLGRPPCARDPFDCTYFRPNRYFCPFMKSVGGWDDAKYQVWKEKRKKWKAQRKFNRGLIAWILYSRQLFWIRVLLIIGCILLVYYWVKGSL
jgi:hypothetical protein